jgi:hypothetical protein
MIDDYGHWQGARKAVELTQMYGGHPMMQHSQGEIAPSTPP